MAEPGSLLRLALEALWRSEPPALLLGPRPPDFDDWLADEVTDGERLYPPSGLPGIHVPEDTMELFLRRTAAPLYDQSTPKGRASADELAKHVAKELPDPFWQAALRSAPVFFSVFSGGAGADPDYEQYIRSINNAYVEVGVSFFDIAERLTDRYTTALLLEQMTNALEAERVRWKERMRLGRYRRAVHLLLEDASNAPSPIKQLLRDWWSEVNEIANHGSEAERGLKVTKELFERSLGVAFFGRSRRGRSQSRPLVTQEIVRIMDRLASTRLAKNYQYALAQATLTLLMPEWCSDLKPEHVRIRYTYQKRKRTKGKTASG